MSKAAWEVYDTILTSGTQKAVLPLMQTRADLYKTINYHAYEDTLDKLFATSNGKNEEVEQSSVQKK